MILNKFYKKRIEVAAFIVSNIRECNLILSELEFKADTQEKLNLEKRTKNLIEIYINSLESINSKKIHNRIQ